MADPWAQYLEPGQPFQVPPGAIPPNSAAPAAAPQPVPVQVAALPPLAGAGVSPAYNDNLVTDPSWAPYLEAPEPKMSALEDIARTVPGAVARGAAGIGGLAGDLENMTGHGVEWALHHGVGAVQDLAGYRGGNPAWPYMGSHTAYNPEGAINYAHANGFADSADLNNKIQDAAGTYHQPQTWQGRAVDTVGQMAPAALFPGGAGARIARVLVPSATSDAAGEATRGTPYEGWARLGGALAGGGLQGFGEGIVNAPKIATSRFMKGYTPENIADAIDFQGRMAAEHGLSLTPFEALVQRSGGAANQLQHYVENTPLGKQATQPFFDARRGQVSGAINSAADFISPPTRQTPVQLGLAANAEANTGLTRARQAINNATKGDYAALPAQEVPAEQYAQIASDPSYGIALKALRDDPELGAQIKGLPDNNMAVVNEVVKHLGVTADQAAGTELSPGNMNLADLRSSAGDVARQLGRDVSPEYARALDAQAQQRADVLAPLQNGPLGAIARTNDVGAQAAALYPKTPDVGGVEDLASALERLSKTGAPLTRQHILNTADASLGDLVGGENQWAGSKFVKDIAGTDERRARLMAGVDQVAGEPWTSRLSDMLEGLQATGKRLPPGSGTTFNAERAALMGVAPVPVRSLASLVDPLEWGQHLNKWVGGAMQRRSVNALADVMTGMDPDQARTFLLDAVSRGNSQAPARLAPALTYASGSRQ